MWRVSRADTKQEPVKPMKTAFVIQHLTFEDLGTFGPLLSRRGFAWRYLEAGIDDLTRLEPDEPDLLVVLGGPIGAYEEDRYPFLADELRLLEQRLAADRPTLGICLGAQLMARALGARVYPGSAKEIGWKPLSLTPAGRSSPLAHLDGHLTSILHWHGDTFDLPEGATLLATSDLYRHQAFAWGQGALAFQCLCAAVSGAGAGLGPRHPRCGGCEQNNRAERCFLGASVVGHVCAQQHALAQPGSHPSHGG